MKQTLFFLLLAAAQTTMAQFAGGTGTPNDPYLVSTYTQLDSVRSYLSSTFRLTNDIDASISATAHGDSGFVPIGNYSTPFTGTFHGGGHKIMHLNINHSSSNYISSNYYIGFFSNIDGNALIDSIGLTDIVIQGNGAVGGLTGGCAGTINDSYTTGSVTGNDWCVGGLVGQFFSGKINNSYSTATVSSLGQVGGLVGDFHGSVTNSYATGSVTGTNYSVGGFIGSAFGSIVNCHANNPVIGIGNVGGFIGSANFANISYCYSTGSVTGTEKCIGGFIGYSGNTDTLSYSYSTGTTTGGTFDAGGFVGANVGSSNISLCYATGNTIGGTAVDDSSFGGLVGYNELGSSISSCYARGSASGYEYVGGLVGNNNGSVSDCYSTGYVAGTNNIGGLIGFSIANSGTATDCFWDCITSGINTSIGGTGKSTIEMRTQAIFTAAGWSNTVWKLDTTINNGYPYLAWQNSTITAIMPASKSTPNDFVLHQNYPNPFNPSTVIGYSLPVTGYVTLKVYDVIGREVATLVNETKNAGRYQVTFNAAKLASGVYFYKLQSGNFTSVKKLVLMK